MKKPKIQILIAFISFIAIIFIFDSISSLPLGKEIIRKDCPQQPMNVDAGIGYCFGAIRYNYLLKKSKITLVVTRNNNGNLSDYGHAINYPFEQFSKESTNEEIKKAQLQWAKDGLTYIHPTGHTMFIPEAAFVGGR